MKNLKYITTFLVLAGITVALYGGIKSKAGIKSEIKTKLNGQGIQGFPDLITITNYVNQ
jgi:hypothetical protein